MLQGEGGLAGVGIDGEEGLSEDFSAIREIRRSNFLCDDVISYVRSETVILGLGGSWSCSDHEEGSRYPLKVGVRACTGVRKHLCSHQKRVFVGRRIRSTVLDMIERTRTASC